MTILSLHLIHQKSMGIFSFFKKAGAKNLDKAEKEAAGKSAEDLERAKVRALYESVNDLPIEVSGLDIDLMGDTVTVKGAVESQSHREKIVLVLGNTSGIAMVNDQITVNKPEPEATFYEVKKGDTLSGIAKAHYGSWKDYMKIFEANTPMLKDPDKIYPGQVLRIPPKEG